MAKKVPLHLVDKAGKCIFCNRPGLSKTHIWPHWLNVLLAPPTARHEVLKRPAHRLGAGTEANVRQGSVFSQKPYLACTECNTGWMKGFEDDTGRFAKPIFTTHDPITLDEDQVRVLAGWLSLITILAEYIDRSKGSITTTPSDLQTLRFSRAPPEQWTIFAASLNGTLWRARYRHRATAVGTFTSREAFLAAQAEMQSNTQLSSFGIGSVFFQVFSCPSPRLVSDYRAVTKQTGMSQLWPLPAGSLWPYAKQGTAKFPTQLILTDETADELSMAYTERIKKLTDFSV